MRVTNDHYNQKIDKVWTHDTTTVYVTDMTGATWAIHSDEHGLVVRAIGAPGQGNDSVRMRPICANQILLRAVRHEDP